MKIWTAWTRWTMWMVVLVSVMCVMGVGMPALAQNELAKNFTAVWSTDASATKTITINASGTLDSLLLKVPGCTAARFKVVDSRSGYVFMNRSLTPGQTYLTYTSQRIDLTGEFYGIVYIYFWMDPYYTSNTITGQLLYRQ